MIAFLTLFLGLVTGAQLVQLEVTDPAIAGVEVALDGVVVGVLRGAPWTLTVDLGQRLAPHELVATAWDAEGRELGETRQWINLPRERTELELIVDEGAGGVGASVALVWGSVDAARAESVRVSLDGQALEPDGHGRFPLPRFDPGVPHLIQAELVAGAVTARAEEVVGGFAGDPVSQDLTPVALVLAEGASLPRVEQMREWVTHRGDPVRVVAIERPGADVVVVEDLDWSLQGQLGKVAREFLGHRASAETRPTGLASRDELRIMVPIATVAGDSRTPSAHFPLSPNLWAGQARQSYSSGAGTRQVAGPVPQGVMVAIPINTETRFDTSGQTLADAVAAAGLSACAGRRGRAVLLIAGSEATDQSRYSPAVARSYLADLGVPLRVWSPVPKLVDPGWGEVASISNRPQLTRAIRELRDLLDRQVVVWLEGRLLPQQVELSAAAQGRLMRLPREARGSDTAAFGEEGVAAAPPARAVSETSGGDDTPTAASPLPASDPPASSAEFLPRFAEATEVRMVTVEVVARDRDRRPVGDLTRDDFSLLDDGAAVEISSFEPPTQLATVSGEAPPAGVERSPEDARRSPPRLAVYLDLATLHRARRARVLDAIEATLAEAEILPQIMIMVHDREIEVALPFTADRLRVVAALAEIRQRPSEQVRDPAVDLLREIGRVQQELVGASQIRDPVARESAITSALTMRAGVEGELAQHAEQSRRAAVALVQSLGRLSHGLAGLDGRRAILYAGDRLTLAPAQELYEEAARAMAAPDSGAGSEQQRQAVLLSEGARSGLSGEVAELIATASAAGVSIYALSPLLRFDSAVIERATSSAAQALTNAAETRAAAIKAAACETATETGGRCQVSGTDLEAFVGSVLGDARVGYTLGFVPSRASDAAEHQLEVSVPGRPDLRLQYRHRYRDQRPGDLLRQMLTANLVLDAGSDPLGVELAVAGRRAGTQPNTQVVTLEVRVPTAAIALVPAADSATRVGRLRLLVQSLDQQGRTAGAQEYPIELELPATKLEATPPPLYQHTVLLTLAEGQHRIAVGVWDELGGRAGFESIEVEVGANEGRPGLL